MSEYKLVPLVDVLSCTLKSISSSILHQVCYVNSCWKAYTVSYQIYNTKATDLHQKINNNAENSSVWLKQTLDNLLVREQPITSRTRVGLGGSAQILQLVLLIVRVTCGPTTTRCSLYCALCTHRLVVTSRLMRMRHD